MDPTTTLNAIITGLTIYFIPYCESSTSCMYAEALKGKTSWQSGTKSHTAQQTSYKRLIGKEKFRRVPVSTQESSRELNGRQGLCRIPALRSYKVYKVHKGRPDQGRLSLPLELQ